MLLLFSITSCLGWFLKLRGLSRILTEPIHSRAPIYHDRHAAGRAQLNFSTDGGVKRENYRSRDDTVENVTARDFHRKAITR
ncbi:hypothetical protein TNIN_204741 [Trichonephila inaurata madagascariensis]|uniref:Secreted protein n=1 Tax=Trichonephila inaurata madagascariensis TaxID=2747483 RepID=A0A8X6MCG6_9ARAC|nr:hypothetical protein TNIN_204741 [Trichonephila inaurata madagascariensis]